MNNNKTASATPWPDSLQIDRRQFCTALGMMGVALATPGLVAGHPLGREPEAATDGPRGRRTTFSKTVGIL